MDRFSYHAESDAEAVLQAQVLDSIVRCSPDHFYLYDRTGKYLYASPSAALALGIRQTDFIGKTWQDLDFPADTMLPFDVHRENVFATGRSWRGEIGFPSADGATIVVHEYVLSPVRDADNRIASVMASLRDISERQRATESLQYQVLHDSLTGLPNRMLFQDRLQQGILAADRYGASLAVVFMDVDQFKHVNDTFGHAAGDLLLQQVGPRWQANLRATDTLARLSGDEFVALLPETGRTGALEVVEKLALATARGFTLETHAVSITVSSGVAVYPEDGTDLGALLNVADGAMYAVKAKGRTRYRRPISTRAAS